MRATLSRSIIAAGLAAALGVPDAAAAPASPPAGASINFQVRIPLVMRLTLHDHPRELQVSAEDAVRGYVDVRGPRIDTIANHPRGYLLQVRLATSLVEGVAIDGLAQPVVANGETAAVPMPATRALEGPRPVSYRLKLAAMAQPGTYAWPVSLALYGP